MNRYNREQARAIPVLAYHQVEPYSGRPPAKPGLVVDTSSFRRQMLVIRALGYRTIGLEQLADGLAGGRALPRRAIVLTFDDGYCGTYQCAFPILRRYGHTATLFLIAEDFVEGQPAATQRAFPILGRAQVAEMLAAGMGIGSHSLSHPRLTDLPIEQARDQIECSKAILEQVFGRTLTSFCYPYGAHRRNLEAAVAAAGYDCAVTTRFGKWQRASERFALRRIPVGAEQGLAQFVYRLLWAREE